MFLQFLGDIPKLVLYGCVLLIVVTLGMIFALFWAKLRLLSQIERLTRALKGLRMEGSAARSKGLPLAGVDKIRSQCEGLPGLPREWWNVIDSNIEKYTSPEDLEGWFLTERAGDLLPYEIVARKNFNAALF